MQWLKLMPLITTDKLDDLRAFYVQKLGFLPTFDSPAYLGLRNGGYAAPVPERVPSEQLRGRQSRR